MIKEKLFFYIFTLLLSSVSCLAQQVETIHLTHLPPTEKMSYYHVKMEGGMEQNSITYLTQDTLGQMWFATKNGVVRYNSNTFYEYKHDPKNPRSIGGNFVERIYVAHDGSIWVGTEPAVLSKYNFETDDFVAIKGIEGDRIKGITQDATGLFWVTSDKHLYSYNDATGALHTFDYGDNTIGLDRILITEDQRIWITTNETFFFEFIPETREFRKINIISPEEKIFGSNTSYYSAFLPTEDSGHYIWLTTPLGFLVRYNPQTGETKRFVLETKWGPDKRLTMMFVFEDDEQNLWAGTWFNGLYKIHPDRKNLEHFMPDAEDPNSLSNTIIHSGFLDKAGYLWFGTEFAGLNVLKKSKKFRVLSNEKEKPNSLPLIPYSATVKDKTQRLWLSTRGKGLFSYDKEKDVAANIGKAIIGDKNLWVFSLLSDKNGNVWIGTNEGLFKYNPVTKATIAYHPEKDNYNSLSGDDVLALLEDGEGNIWISSAGHGINKLNPQTGNFQRFAHDKDNKNSLSNDIARCFAYDTYGDLWVGTLDGLNKFNKKTGDFTVFKHSYEEQNTISANKINCLLENEGSLWIGSYGGGLTKYDFKTKIFKTFLKEDGLPDNNVKSINVDDHNNLWIATTRHLSKFDNKTEQFVNYGKSDGLENQVYLRNYGLQDLEFYTNFSYKDEDGYLYFGGTGGLIIFHPDSLSKNNYKPPTNIEHFLVNGEPYPLHGEDKITLSPLQNNFSIFITPINFIQPEKNQVAYYLENYDSAWHFQPAGKLIEYFNLPRGEYIFHYNGANNDGVWNEKTASLAITVMPYFYEKTSFYIIGIGALILAFLLYRRYLHQQIERKKRQSRYKSSKLKEEDVLEINEKLITALLEERLYLEPDLSLQKLASSIAVKPHALSQVINQVHNRRFHDFINMYRVKEAKRLLKVTEMKIVAVAYESGFNSISTFNAVFKKETGQTPSGYRKSTVYN